MKEEQDSRSPGARSTGASVPGDTGTPLLSLETAVYGCAADAARDLPFIPTTGTSRKSKGTSSTQKFQKIVPHT